MGNNNEVISEVEIWKPVKGYEGLYEVSSFGRVKTLLGKNGKKLLRLTENVHGYYRVALYKNKKVKSFSAHRLTAHAFIGDPPSEGYVINHKNGIKTDNRFQNLEWCTSCENTRHAIATGLRPRINKKCTFRAPGGANPFSKTVYMCDLNGHILKVYPTVTEAAKQNKIARNSIWKCAKGVKVSHNGVTWRY